MKTVAKIIGFLGFWYCVGFALVALLGPTLGLFVICLIILKD